MKIKSRQSVTQFNPKMTKFGVNPNHREELLFPLQSLRINLAKDFLNSSVIFFIITESVCLF